MRPPVRAFATTLVLALLVGAVTALAATTASGIAAGVASPPPANFTDPSGDAQGGPDITSVVISGDPATRSITVTATATNFPSTTTDALIRVVSVWIDTDKNASTGDPEDGSEYLLQVVVTSAERWWAVGRWNGSTWEDAPQTPPMSFLWRGDALSWTLNASNLGGASSFNFYVSAGTWDNNHTDVTLDTAPDSGRWSYDLSGTPPPTPTPAPSPKTVALKIDAPTTSPRLAVAGKRFTVSYRVYSETQETTTVIDVAGGTKTATIKVLNLDPGGKMVCDPSAAGKVIPHTESYKTGTARLSFVVPKTAKGKLLKVTVKITTTDKETGTKLSASRIATFRVR